MNTLEFMEKIKKSPHEIDIMGNNWLMTSLMFEPKVFLMLIETPKIYDFIESVMHKNYAGNNIFDLLKKMFNFEGRFYFLSFVPDH
jgi:hypothetical protein